MTVAVKVSDLIKLLKDIRNDGIREITIEVDPKGDPDFDIPPNIHIDGIDPDGDFDSIDCGEIYGRAVDE